MDALKSPVLTDDIEIDPSAIGQFLHTDYIHSTSTPNIHQLQIDTVSDCEDTPQTILPHSSTMHSFSNSIPAGQAPTVATDKIPKKLRVPSTRSIKRRQIISMAEAGDKPSRGYSSTNTTRRSSSVSSLQGSQTHSSQSSSLNISTTSQTKKVNISSQKSSMGKNKKKTSTTSSGKGSGKGATSATQPPKNLNQKVMVYENRRYKKISLK